MELEEIVKEFNSVNIDTDPSLSHNSNTYIDTQLTNLEIALCHLVDFQGDDNNPKEEKYEVFIRMLSAYSPLEEPIKKTIEYMKLCDDGPEMLEYVATELHPGYRPNDYRVGNTKLHVKQPELTEKALRLVREHMDITEDIPREGVADDASSDLLIDIKEKLPERWKTALEKGTMDYRSVVDACMDIYYGKEKDPEMDIARYVVAYVAAHNPQDLIRYPEQDEPIDGVTADFLIDMNKTIPNGWKKALESGRADAQDIYEYCATSFIFDEEIESPWDEVARYGLQNQRDVFYESAENARKKNQMDPGTKRMYDRIQRLEE